MLYLFFVDSGDLERQDILLYQELIHMPNWIWKGIINHINAFETQS
jgi:hypothetical protein